MPELPEVETIKRYLNKTLVGKKIKAISVLKPKSFIGNPREIIGAEIIRVKRRGKLIIIGLSNNKSLLIHLKMSGQLIYINKLKCQKSKLKAATQKSEQNKYTRIIINFTDGNQLLFNDLRIFGWIKIVDWEKLKVESLKLGLEPFSKEFTTEYLTKIFSRTKKPVKLVIMDQEKIAGIGNIYANEILFDAEISPLKPAKDLIPTLQSGSSAHAGKIKKLRDAIIKILKAGIKYKGSSAKDDQYRQANGERGNYQKHFLVYQKDGEKCQKCDSLIIRTKLGGRGTFWCERCQR